MQLHVSHRLQNAVVREPSLSAWTRLGRGLTRLGWLCPLLMLALVAAILAAFEFSIMNIALILILISCPMVIAIAWLTGISSPPG